MSLKTKLTYLFISKAELHKRFHRLSPISPNTHKTVWLKIISADFEKPFLGPKYGPT